MLFPVHVMLMELAIDPICALVFEAEPSEAQAMTRPPRRPQEALFGAPQIGLALVQGVTILGAVFGVYAWALTRDPEPAARGAAFVALVLANLVLALTDAASTGRLLAPHRRTFWIIALAIAALMTAVLTAPALADIFRVERPDPLLLAATLATAIVSGGWLGAASRLREAFRRPRAPA